MLTIWLHSASVSHADSCERMALDYERAGLVSASLPSGLLFFAGGDRTFSGTAIRMHVG